MGEKHHLQRRGSVWYYRRRVPKELQSKLAKSFIQLSLNTTSKTKAIKARELLDVQYSREFERMQALELPVLPNAAAEQAMGSQVLTEARAVEIARAYVRANDERRRHGDLATQPQDADERQAWEKDLELELAIARGRAHDFDRDQILSEIKGRMFPHASFTVDEGTFPSAAIFDLVKRAAIELERRALARMRDDHRQPHFDVLFDPAQPSAVTVGYLAEEFLTLKIEEGRAAKVAQKGLDRQTANVALVREILGDATPVRNLNWDACRRFCSVLAQIPPNRTKIYPGIPLTEAISRAQLDGRLPLTATTQQQYLATFKEMLGLAVKKDLLRVNYAADFRPLTVDALSPEERRIPFTINQLKTLFNCKFYRDCASAGPVPYRFADKPWRYWYPLVSLFTSMRPKEFFQMHVTDLKRTDQGTWYLDVIATSDEDDFSEPTQKRR